MYIPLSYNPISLKRFVFASHVSWEEFVVVKESSSKNSRSKRTAYHRKFLLYITGNNIKRFILTIVDKINSIEILWEIYKRYSHSIAKVRADKTLCRGGLRNWLYSAMNDILLYNHIAFERQYRRFSAVKAGHFLPWIRISCCKCEQELYI